MSSLLRTSSSSILIFGSGCIGRAVGAELRAEGHRVTMADIRDGIGAIVIDLTDEEAVKALAEKLPPQDVIIMCASTRGGDAETYSKLYVTGTKHIRNAFPSARLIFCSSTSVYGVTDGRWVTEQHNVDPSNNKTQYLLQAEQNILSTTRGIVVRLSAIYSPERCVLVSRYLETGTALPGAPDRWLNYIHRDDAANALSLLATLSTPPTGIYNLTDRTPMQMKDIYAYLSDLLNIPYPSFTPAAPRSSRGQSNQRISCARMLTLGWDPLYPCFVDGVHNVLETLSPFDH